MNTYSPPWVFMQGRTGKSRNRRSDNHPPPGYSMQDWIDDQRAWLNFQEEQDKKRKDDEKTKKDKEKKPPSAAEALLSFFQWWAVMSVLGLPIGLITLKLLNMAVQSVPLIVQNAVK